MEMESPEQTIKRFIRFRKAEGKTESTIEAYVRILNDLKKFYKKPFKTLTRHDLEVYLADWSERKGKRFTKTSPTHMNFVRTVLKYFYKWLYEEEEYPPCVKWIKLKRVPREIDPRDILTEEEILQMIRAAASAENQTIAARDQALIHILYESGGRISEIRNRKVGDVTFEMVGNGEPIPTVRLFILREETKGKERGKYLRLVESTQALKEWLAVHPNPSPEQPLWINLQSHYGKMISRSTIRRMLKRVANRAGITKPVNPHAFRHAQVTASAKYLADQELKKKFGWTPGSQMLRIYSHITDRAVDEKELEMRGIKKVKDVSKRILTHVKCPQCSLIWSAGKRICECGRPLDPELGERYDLKKQEKELLIAQFFEFLSTVPTKKLKQINEILRSE